MAKIIIFILLKSYIPQAALRTFNPDIKYEIKGIMF
jgi:hypothetical protein